MGENVELYNVELGEAKERQGKEEKRGQCRVLLAEMQCRKKASHVVATMVSYMLARRSCTRGNLDESVK